VDDEKLLDLGKGLTISDGDRAALHRLRKQTPSWLDWDWRTLTELLPQDALAKRPTASDAWEPFRLD
jgi:hypothetical protein